MKKIVLKKASSIPTARSIGYRINYQNELNAAQYDAVMHNDGAALVIAGAGTGKTRTLVYRVSRLIEDNIAPESILLLTFTRKSANEMLRRASNLLDGRCEKVSGGTFHSFALSTLKQFSEKIGYQKNFTVLDQSDTEDLINSIRTKLKLSSSKKRFPQKSTLASIFSAAVNKRITIEEVIESNYRGFADETERILQVHSEFESYKLRYNIMTYDDLLLNLLKLLKSSAETLNYINNKYKYILVDEYQDTNRLQHEIVLLLSGKTENIMAVGDDAQSIYSFRGAEAQNIFFFPESFSNCKIYKIEENYRSTQAILNLTNKIIADALFKYEKELYTRRTASNIPLLISCKTEREQSEFVVHQILQLREEGVPLAEIAVLFRSGFHSFDLEIELSKANLPYQKFGGLKFVESAHIKDLLAMMRVLSNPFDAISWQRIFLLLDGVGPSTAEELVSMLIEGKISIDDYSHVKNIKRGRESVEILFDKLQSISNSKFSPGEIASQLSEYYHPILRGKYDDYSKRQKDIDTFATIAESYRSLNSFLNDMAIDPPTDTLGDILPDDHENEFLTLSTIHSAKGLEWKAVFLIWALEGRFPSAKSGDNLESMEEERRLFYVACTRAKDELYISYPVNIYDRETGFVLSRPSRFIDNIPDTDLERCVISDEE